LTKLAREYSHTLPIDFYRDPSSTVKRPPKSPFGAYPGQTRYRSNKKTLLYNCPLDGDAYISPRKNQAVITRKKFVDDFPTTDEAIGPKTRASIRQGLKEMKAGRGRGPFKNAKDVISDLHRKAGGVK
jgi:hypothetical protein